jgi:hypothetical protein
MPLPSFVCVRMLRVAATAATPATGVNLVDLSFVPSGTRSFVPGSTFPRDWARV